MSDLGRIQGNVRSMIEQGAPSTDIDAYLKAEGHTPDSFAKSNAMGEPVSTEDPGLSAMGRPGVSNDATGPQTSAPSALNAAVNIAGSNLAKGFTGIGGAAGDVRSLAGHAADWIGSKIGDPGFGEAYRKVARPMGPIGPTSTALNAGLFTPPGATGPLAMPEAKAADIPALTLSPPALNGGKINLGSMLDAGIQAIPGMMTAGMPSVLPALGGGATSDLAGQATHGTPYEIPARILGGIPGFMLGQKATTPLPANLTPEEQRLVGLAKENPFLKDTLTIGQETGRGRGIEDALSRFPTSQGRMAAAADAQKVGINRTALAEGGFTGDRLDPTSMTDVNQKASAAFEAAKNNSGPVKLDKDFYKALEGTVGKYLENTPASQVAPVVGKRAGDFVDLAKTTATGPRLAEAATDTALPELSGAQYQQFRKGLNDTMMELNPGGGEYKALKGMRVALDDAMEASLPAAQAAAWHDVRKNWSILKTLNKATAGGSLDSRSAGNLSPNALTAAIKGRQGADRFATETGGLNDVARLAAYLGKTSPNSGTPQTLMMQSMLTGGPIAAGYAVGGIPGAAAAGAGMMAPNVAARITTGAPGLGWLRNYLANQALPEQGLSQLPQSTLPGLLQGPRVPEHRR